MRKRKSAGILIAVVMMLLICPAGVWAGEYPFLIMPGGTNPLSNFGQQLESVFDNSAQTIGQPVTQPSDVQSPPTTVSTMMGGEIQALPNASSVMIDGKRVAFEAYTINGYNYFKLRDLAMAMDGSEKQFDVAWDGTKNAINLLINKSYVVTGGELATSGLTANHQAIAATSKLYVDGKEVGLTAYTINKYTYFKLRDVGEAINFAVSWDGAANTIRIDTASEYGSE